MLTRRIFHRKRNAFYRISKFRRAQKALQFEACEIVGFLVKKRKKEFGFSVILHIFEFLHFESNSAKIWSAASF